MIVYIEWEDAWTKWGWSHKDDLTDGLFPCKTIGFLVSEDDDVVLVAPSYSDRNETYGDVANIPRANIKKYLEITVKTLEDL